MNGRPSLTPALLLPFLAACAMSTEPSVTEESTPSTTSESTPSSEEDTGGRLVVDLIDGTMLDEARAATGLDLEWVSPLSADESLAVVEVANFERALSELEDLHLVEAAEPSMTYVASAFPNDPMHEKQWNFRKIGAASGWRVGAGEGVTVAVIDTGVSAVPDLEGTELLPGATFVPGTRTADDDNGHGTHVAGTIAQTTHNGLGVAGLAPRATVLPIKALSGSGMGRSEWIASAIDEATDQGADIINLSLGGSRSKVIEVAVDKAVAKGVLVVAAAGNSGREGVGWPAAHPAVLGVSATGPTDDLAFYSSWGKGVVLSAPGGDMRQPGGGILQDTVTSGDHAFKELQGTSMASPHVAGAAAVLMGAGATSGADARSLLEATAVDLGEPGPDARFGIGRIDLGAAVHALTINRHGLLFGLGALVALFMTALGSVSQRGRVILASAVAAGGLFFLPLLPLPPNAVLATLAKPLLLWPQALGSLWVGFPLWVSAAVPMVLTFVLGPTRTLGPVVAGLSLGVGTHLAWGAVTGGLQPWLMPGGMGTAWLGANALVCLLCAMAIFGLQKSMDRKD